MEATKSRVGDRGDGDPDEDPTEERDHGHARDVPRGVLAAERQADGDGVDHQGGAVVGEALGLQQHELAAGQALGQGGRGGGVGRGDGGTQDQGRLPRDPKRRHDPRHGEGGGHHEHRRGDQDAAQVASDGVLGGGEALPEQQAREEQQQHHLGGHVKAFQAGHEGQREPEEDLRQRHRKTQLGGQGVARHHRNPDSDRDDETLHAPPFPDFPRRIPRLGAGPVELSPMSPNRFCSPWNWSCRNRGDRVRGLGSGLFSAAGGFDSAARWRSRAGSTSLGEEKLVEPACSFSEQAVSKPR